MLPRRMTAEQDPGQAVAEALACLLAGCQPRLPLGLVSLGVCQVLLSLRQLSLQLPPVALAGLKLQLHLGQKNVLVPRFLLGGLELPLLARQPPLHNFQILFALEVPSGEVVQGCPGGPRLLHREVQLALCIAQEAQLLLQPPNHGLPVLHLVDKLRILCLQPRHLCADLLALQGHHLTKVLLLFAQLPESFLCLHSLLQRLQLHHCWAGPCRVNEGCSRGTALAQEGRGMAGLLNARHVAQAAELALTLALALALQHQLLLLQSLVEVALQVGDLQLQRGLPGAHHRQLGLQGPQLGSEVGRQLVLALLRHAQAEHRPLPDTVALQHSQLPLSVLQGEPQEQ
eukprot:RCo018179